MPKEVEAQARKELRRYERMPEQASEAGMIRTYLDTLVELPWALPEEKPIDIAEARRVLEADHFGLEKIKQRIIEYLAVRKLAPQGKAPILCFVGPPGVGKTSLGQSIARAMQRPFTRVSLGGVHDEAEIRGHRRTYIGALPGNIVQGIKKAGARNCVMMLDEIDKMGRGIQGDPSAAMLEVLDPEQNSTFRDAYLGVPFDLSRVTFITTANLLETIPGPLQDRMEIIALAGYTGAEKLQIARRYLVARQLEANGLTAAQASIDDEALSEIIHSYTREAGVRSLEREIGKVFRHVAVRIAETPGTEVQIHAPDLAEIMGQPRFENEVAMRTAIAGVATGLAWTPVGGDILFIEATKAPGKGGLILTGQLGDVMRESAQAALSLIKNRAASLAIDTAVFEKSDIHIHVPRRDTQGWAECGRRHVHRALFAAQRADRAPRYRHDGRDQPQGARAASGRHQGEGDGRGPGGAQARAAAGAQSQGLRRDPRGYAQEPGVRLAGGRQWRDPGGLRGGEPGAARAGAGGLRQ